MASKHAQIACGIVQRAIHAADAYRCVHDQLRVCSASGASSQLHVADVSHTIGQQISSVHVIAAGM